MLKKSDYDTKRAGKKAFRYLPPFSRTLIADLRFHSSSAKANSLSCFKFFEERVRKYPNAEAIWSREGTCTWKELHTKACQYAGYFLELGLRPGELVAFCLQNSPDFICAWLGLWAIVRFYGF